MRLQILLELVLTTSSYPFGFLFFELGGHGDKLGTCLSIVLCLAGLCKSAKLEVRVGTGLICQHYRVVIGSNMVAFTGGEAGDVRADLSTTKSVVNAEVMENLLCFICNDRGGDKILLKVIDLSRKKTFSTVLFRCPSL